MVLLRVSFFAIRSSSSYNWSVGWNDRCAVLCDHESAVPAGQLDL